MSKEIPLTQGQVAIVDDDDFDYLNQWKWFAQWCPGTKSYYAKRNSHKGEEGWIHQNKRRPVAMHNVVMKTPKEKFVDHINHDTLDNRKGNLRIVTHRQNMQHMNSFSTSKFPGVSWKEDMHKWRVRIQLKGKEVTIGYFSDEREAAKAYEKYLREHVGEELICKLRRD